ncbi:MAG: hypothetical protein AB7K24_08655 [Gemmataceae bacterium]
MLSMSEKCFLGVFLHEASSPPFRGAATDALHAIGVWHDGILSLPWAYEQEVPRTSFHGGHASDVAPVLPWQDRDAALRPNAKIERVWKNTVQQAASRQ